MSFDASEVSNTVITGPFVTCTAASGGTVLGSGATPYGVHVTNVALVISGAVFVGGTGSNAPFSGQGYYLLETQSLNIPVSNLNQIRVCAAVSGVRVSYIGFG